MKYGYYMHQDKYCNIIVQSMYRHKGRREGGVVAGFQSCDWFSTYGQIQMGTQLLDRVK